jgi:hypothetical protein
MRSSVGVSGDYIRNNLVCGSERECGICFVQIKDGEWCVDARPHIGWLCLDCAYWPRVRMAVKWITLK